MGDTVDTKSVVVDTSESFKSVLPAIGRKFKLSLAAVIFLVLNVLVLYLLHFLHKPPPPSIVVSSSAFSSATGNTDKRAVSLAANGAVRLGAGTTAYLDAAVLPGDANSQLKYVVTSPLGTSAANYPTNLLSYYLPSSKQAVVTTVAVNADRTLTLGAGATLANDPIRGIATLSDSVVVLLQASSFGATMVTTATVTASPADIKVSTKTASIATGSATNAIGRVSASVFATVSFEPYNAAGPWSQYMLGGAVAADGSITLTAPLPFGDPNSYDAVTFVSVSTAFGDVQTLSAFPNMFVLPWWSNFTPNNKGLCIILVEYASSGLTKKTETCTLQYKPATYVSSTAIAPDTFAMAFYDANNGNTLTIAVIQISTTTQKAFFRGAYTMGSAAAGSFDFGKFYSWFPKPSLRALSPTRVAVAFLNPSSAGRPFTQVFQVTDTLALVPTTPLMRLSNGDFTLAGQQSGSGSVTLDVVPTSDESFVVAYAGVLGTSLAPKRLTLVESFGDVIGVASGSNGMTMGGVAAVASSALSVGKEYFSTTRGDIVAVTMTDASADYFFVGNATIVSRNARIGIAVASDAIYVSPR